MPYTKYLSKLSDEKKDRLREIVEMKLDGKNNQEIADYYGMTRERVRQLLMAFVTGKDEHLMTDRDILECLKNGMSRQAISDINHIRRSRVDAIARANKIRMPRESLDGILLDVARDYNNGFTYDEIAYRNSISKSYVIKLVKDGIGEGLILKMRNKKRKVK